MSYFRVTVAIASVATSRGLPGLHVVGVVRDEMGCLGDVSAPRASAGCIDPRQICESAHGQLR